MNRRAFTRCLIGAMCALPLVGVQIARKTQFKPEFPECFKGDILEAIRRETGSEILKLVQREDSSISVTSDVLEVFEKRNDGSKIGDIILNHAALESPAIPYGKQIPAGFDTVMLQNLGCILEEAVRQRASIPKHFCHSGFLEDAFPRRFTLCGRALWPFYVDGGKLLTNPEWESSEIEHRIPTGHIKPFVLVHDITAKQVDLGNGTWCMQIVISAWMKAV